MQDKTLYIGEQQLKTTRHKVNGEIVMLDGQPFYKISHYNQMAPFFMNIISDSDLWMFISSNGALTAGRKNADNALFPYYTDDKIHDAHDITGSKTILRVTREGKTWLWQPFSEACPGIYTIERHICKNMPGNQLLFEEINHDLQLTFQYSWRNCDQYGFIRRSRVINNSSAHVFLHILDGLQNILPADVGQRFQNEYSTLIDGYKKSELQADTGLAAYILSSIPTDKAEPSESLRANTVWSTGLPDAKILLSSRQLAAFRQTGYVAQETDVKGQRGAYFVTASCGLAAKEAQHWYIVADVNKDQSAFAALNNFITSNKDMAAILENETDRDSQSLWLKLARADGLQQTADTLNIFRHCANTLFNILRGGIFDNGYYIDKHDLSLFLNNANSRIAEQQASWLQALPDSITIAELDRHLPEAAADLQRLCYEYLPLTFSRRHGDPSRPWNQFSIDIRDDKGNKKLDYQGNWRDIFQNWEALALSYPQYIERMIVKFVNASTADGYNPYRVTRDGFDWEVIDPDDPWSYIGYWGDHQIIYLLKLLELSQKYHPGLLQSWLDKRIFTYARVPYRIKPYTDIIKDPHNTVDFDAALDGQIRERVATLGADGSCISDEKNDIFHASLLEKWLVPLLVKLSNFIPEAGIWMNTQRPEWNDANNALVGYGTSMVTLYYLRRFVAFSRTFFEKTDSSDYAVSEEILHFFEKTDQAFDTFDPVLNSSFSDVQRRQFLDHVGQAGSDYRQHMYDRGFSGRRATLSVSTLQAFLRKTLKYLDHSIKASKRVDNLFHAYNLVRFEDAGGIHIRNLYEMLEGQVAVLSSGYLTPEDALTLLRALRESSLYREDQSGYLLYPDRQLARFVDKNIIPENQFEKSAAMQKAQQFADAHIIIQDTDGKWHFNSKFRNARILKETLCTLNADQKQSSFTEAEIDELCRVYESVFDHQSFTGRSGTFYKYEGLGSIYWHMVSKLLLAVQEIYFQTLDQNIDDSIRQEIKDFYYDIRAGIGHHKNPAVYGAFPTDPYSHTPAHSGVQQPGMTGQVKEDVISRFGELGVVVSEGKITFNPQLLLQHEFLTREQAFEYVDLNNQRHILDLKENSLAFTICQVPVMYVNSDVQKIIVSMQDGPDHEIEGLQLSAALSASVFQREGRIEKVTVMIKE